MDILDTQTLAPMPVYTTEEAPTEKKSTFLDNFFKYAEQAVGLYKTAKSDKPIGQPGYDISMGVQPEKKVLGMPPITGYIVIATVIGLLGYAIYAVKNKNKGKK